MTTFELSQRLRPLSLVVRD